MATAGRILIIPRGKYDEATEYDALDMVSYGGKGYVCKKTSIGILPTDETYWAECIDVSEELDALDKKIANVESASQNQNFVFASYSALVATLNNMNENALKVGQTLRVREKNVPDLYVSQINANQHHYNFTTSQDMVTIVSDDGYVVVGYYELRAVEGVKEDYNLTFNAIRNEIAELKEQSEAVDYSLHEDIEALESNTDDRFSELPNYFLRLNGGTVDGTIVATGGFEGSLNGIAREAVKLLETLPLTGGGTGATTPSDALRNFGLTATAQELNHMDGVTSNVQTQLNNKSSVIFATTKVSVTAKANARANASLTPPTTEGYNFYPINVYTGGTPYLALTSIGTGTLKVCNISSTEQTVEYTVRWIGVK